MSERTGERVQKVLSRAGIASRRKAEELIREGRVTVNGDVVTLGARVDPGQDWVKVDGRHLGCVVRVEGSGRDLKLVVESASDLRRRTVNPRRKRVELVQEN